MANGAPRRRSRFAPPAPPGAPPGTLVAAPEAKTPIIRVMAYGPASSTEGRLERPEQVSQFLGEWPVTWVNVDGVGDPKIISQFGALFGLHRLALEDVMNVHQRPKVEHYDTYVFIVARMADIRNDALHTEQISIFLGKDFVLTFQETFGDCFDPVRESIRRGTGRIRGAGPDYLAYRLLDAFIDFYYPVLENYADRLDTLEVETLTNPDEKTISRLHTVRRELLMLRRSMWPHREALNALHRDPSLFIKDETRVYFRNLYDHTVQIMDLIENLRELSSGLVEIYMSTSNKQMNEAVKVLTAIATIFMPLTLITSIYGMNFDPNRSPLNMPELRWYWGYPFALGLIFAVGVTLFVIFRKKGWI